MDGSAIGTALGRMILTIVIVLIVVVSAISIGVTYFLTKEDGLIVSEKIVPKEKLTINEEGQVDTLYIYE